MSLRFFARFSLLRKVALLERYFVVVVFFAAITTMVISMAIGLSQSIWFDEGYSISVAQQPIAELIALTTVDAHPPLYYLLLKTWMAIFGTGEFALRFSSVLCGGLSLVALSWLLKDLFNRRIALLALPFVAFAPFLLRYNYEIRMYSFVMLIGVVATWVMVRAWQTRQARWWIVYGALVAIGMYTLYMSVVFWLAHVVWLTIMAYQSKRNVVKQPFWLSYVGAVIVFLPWIPTVLSQLSSSALPPFMSTITLYELTNILGLLMAYSAGWQIGPWLTVLLVLFLSMFAYVFANVWRRAVKRERQALLLLISCFVVGILFYALISLPPNPPRFMDRYIVHISIFWYALLGVVIAYGWRLKNKVPVYLLTIATAILIASGVVTQAQIGNYNFQRTQLLQAQVMRQEIGCEDTTFVTAGPYGYIDLKYNFAGCEMRYYYPWDVTLTGGFAPVNDSVDRINTTQNVITSRLVYIYYDDSDVVLTPDDRFREVARRDYDKTHVIIYER